MNADIEETIIKDEEITFLGSKNDKKHNDE